MSYLIIILKMKITFTILFFSLIMFSLSAQKTVAANERDASGKIIPDSLIGYFPNTICLEGYGSFIQWKDAPVEFSFQLYDRWGSLVATSDKYDFNMDDIMPDRKKVYLYQDVYVYKIEYTAADGTKKKFLGHLTYLNWYCNCG